MDRRTLPAALNARPRRGYRDNQPSGVKRKGR